MSPHRDDHLDLCAARVLGILSPSDSADLDAHLAERCEVCEAELRAFAGAAGMLALAVPQHAVPVGLRARVLEAVRAEVAPALGRPTPAETARELPSRGRPVFAVWAWAAAAALLLVASLYAWRRVDTLSAELLQAQANKRTLEQELEGERRWTALLEQPTARVVKLSPTPDGDSTLAAHLLYDPASGRAVVMAEQFVAPQGNDYELWAITASGPTSLGVLRGDAGGRLVAKLDHVSVSGTIIAFAFSREATGGSLDHHKPAGPVVMVGKLAI